MLLPPERMQGLRDWATVSGAWFDAFAQLLDTDLLIKLRPLFVSCGVSARMVKGQRLRIQYTLVR